MGKSKGKVIHVSDEFHKEAKAHCDRIGMRLGQWAESVLSDVLHGKLEEPKEVKEPELEITEEPSGKKKLLIIQEELTDEFDIWSRPPFWVQRKGTQCIEEGTAEDGGGPEGGDIVFEVNEGGVSGTCRAGKETSCCPQGVPSENGQCHIQQTFPFIIGKDT